MSASAHRRLQDPRYLVGHWPLNGHAQDVSGHRNHGAWDAAEAYTAGPFGRQVAVFNATTSGIRILDNAVINMTGWSGVTMIAWIRQLGQAENNSGRIMVKGTIGGLLTIGDPSPRNMYGFVNTALGDATVLKTGVLSDNVFAYQIGFTWESTTGRPQPYLNGNNIGQAGAVRQSAISSDTGNVLMIGNSTAGDRCFNGWIWDVRLYNIALTGSEISALYEFDRR